MAPDGEGYEMPLNFETLQTDAEVSWPKRGRKPEPIPEAIADALHKSYANGTTASMVLAKDKVITFRNLLSKAGKQLNYRIDHEVQESQDRPGYVVYYFRTRARRKAADINE